MNAKREDLQVTLDGHDTVLTVARPAGFSRWRFKRRKPRLPGHTYKLTEEREQEIMAMYVDHPDIRVDEISKIFGTSNGALARLIELFGLPMRNPNQAGPRRPKIVPALLPSTHSVANVKTESKMKRDKWRVTVTKTVVEDVEADSLLDLAAIYDGSDAKIVKIERI